MRRAVFHTLGSLLVLASYLWGSCVSCRQVLADRESANCCQRDKCDRASHGSSKHEAPPASHGEGCEQMPWTTASAQDARVQAASDYASTPAQVPTAVNLVQPGYVFHNPQYTIAASPPDLPILHTSLLI